MIFLGPEEFRDIPGYEGLYKIGSKGTVVSYAGKKPIIRKHNVDKQRKNQRTILLSNDTKVKRFSVAKLMAQVFELPNPHGYHYVGFKDGNKDNLDIENLEWQKLENPQAWTEEAKAKRSKTWKEKRENGYKPDGEAYLKISRKVSAYDDEGLWVATFRSITIASKLIGANNIGQALRLGCKSGEYYWRYEETWE